ncbi:MAG: helix-hairpin-helix domain-containing protein [Bacteroidetes bacterium]|nr:helix-hairpin-helix domain-containing protein [Bacteroidota bacterium]
MKQFFRDYFTFNRRERNGVFILLSIIILLLLYLSFSDFFFPQEKTDFSKFEKEIAEFETAQKKAADSITDSRKNYFSGNSLVSDSEETEKVFTKEKKYQKFEKKNNYEKTEKIVENKFPKKNATVIVELNSADTTSLKQLKGIGSGFAKRIVKFRDLLGGFVKKEQLLEVYGFDKEKFDLVSPQLEIDLSKVKKININSASVDDLKKHPYMDKKAAIKIFWHRINKGDYSDVSDIMKDNLVDGETFSKLAPYLTVK